MDSTTIDVSFLPQTFSIETGDFLHIFRANEYSMLLSYKSSAMHLLEVFQNASILSRLKSELEAAQQELATISSTMLLRSEAKTTYASLETLQSKKEQLLTNSSMDTIVSKYVTEDDMKNKAAQARTEAHKLADEITDFTGAAMVGINQSNSSYSSSEEETEGKETKD